MKITTAKTGYVGLAFGIYLPSTMKLREMIQDSRRILPPYFRTRPIRS